MACSDVRTSDKRCRKLSSASIRKNHTPLPHNVTGVHRLDTLVSSPGWILTITLTSAYAVLLRLNTWRPHILVLWCAELFKRPSSAQTSDRGREWCTTNCHCRICHPLAVGNAGSRRRAFPKESEAHLLEPHAAAFNSSRLLARIFATNFGHSADRVNIEYVR